MSRTHRKHQYRGHRIDAEFVYEYRYREPYSPNAERDGRHYRPCNRWVKMRANKMRRNDWKQERHKLLRRDEYDAPAGESLEKGYKGLLRYWYGRNAGPL